ncbi:hypothetical protein MASR1M8_08140 [Thermomonas brevis]
MTKLLALAQFLLALGGCSLGATNWSHRVSGDAGDTLRSDIVAEDGIARFRCLESASGACHYTLYPATCRDDACASTPLRRFTVARGGERRIAGLAGFTPCVAGDAAATGTDCRAR